MILQTPLKKVIQTTSYYFSLLEKNHITTIGDFLEYYPRTYEDRSQIVPLSRAAMGTSVQIRGRLLEITKTTTKNGYKLIKGIFEDVEQNECEIIWFNQQYLATTLKTDKDIVLSGKIKVEKGKMVMMSPSFEYVQPGKSLLHFGRIIPIYSEIDKITTDWFRKKMGELKKYIAEIPDLFSPDFRKENELLEKKEAVMEVHFPTESRKLEQAKRTLAFEEMYLLQYAQLQRKKEAAEQGRQFGVSIPIQSSTISTFLSTLPFALTDHQKIAIFQILKDMESTIPMQRMLEGDVGSGKTLVALIVALHTVMQSKLQVAFLVPTEVLAFQHFTTTQKFFENYGLRIGLLTGSVSKSEKKSLYEKIASHDIDIVIGTHALIQDSVQFAKLGLVVVDEQHRFGVAQRDKLLAQGYPHVLHMTATPIPRSLALTMYGDMDLSVIRHLPAGRKTVVTKVIPPHKKQMMYDFIRSECAKGRQVFIICPLIEESEKLEDVKAVTKEFEFLQEHIFPEFSLALLHGKMTPDEKASVMKAVVDKNHHILVATSVIEVGIDIPNATCIVIEGSDRFGLSQLHQLRGRVGRGEHQSYCFLATEKSFPDSLIRLRAMEDHHDGFALAEIDLEMRGPGEVYGVRQSGIPDLKMAQLYDIDLIVETRNAALKQLDLYISPNA